MRIQVKAVPRAKRPGVERLADGTWRVAVSAPAEDGKANAAVVDALAKHFDVPKFKALEVIAFAYYHVSWPLYVIKPAWSYELNAASRDPTRRG